MKNILKVICSILLLPLVFFAAEHLFFLLWRLLFSGLPAFCFLGGAALYLTFHFFVYNFSRFYVAAHEFTHAVVALFFGYKVKGLKISKDSGNVKLDGFNEIVVLAPYVIPLYFLVFALISLILIYNGLDNVIYRNIYSFIFGFLFCFHITHTLKTLFEVSQPDVKMAGGRIFSFVVITLSNIIFILIFLAVVFPSDISLLSFFYDIFARTLLVWKKLLNYIFGGIVEIFRL
ncbi:hypothetical protein Emin_1345 [Elusimicrobium minutum Pei191]|uniref:Uncharacterized protein n=1 Tax=Elusimicrobium minutum (strain Pei191) TaxID=445932 RepID=B2KEE9_ELUMP|nr:hypothetical protein [Elusimicrobium minutum]ACC98895.1 hypothetical protein Emin_1345 [Elusimicrobium minutum Pei191]